MTRILCAIAILALPVAALAANPYLNLDFEDGRAGSAPRGWYAGGEGFAASLSAESPHGGELCLLLERTDTPQRGFGVATATFPVADAAGRRIRYTGWIRTEAVTNGFAGLWWRADDAGGTAAFDNMARRGVTGDTEWTEHVIELDIPADATNINFGCILPADGRAWFDDLAVSIDGAPYAQERPAPFVATGAQQAWLRDHAAAFVTDDPAQDHDDLESVRDMVGDARIVALGEGTHGTAEFFRMKHRLVRFLAEEMGFTMFAIEATMPECEKLNAYVLGGEGDPAALIAGMYFWTWRTEEVLALVEWMRAYNAQGGRLEFRGFDMQHPSWAMKDAQDFIAAHAPDLLLQASVTYAEMRGALRDNAEQRGGYGKVSASVAEGVSTIVSQLEERHEALVAAAGERDYAWAVQSARLVDQYARLARGAFGERDLAMADNVDWLLRQAPEGTKIVLWAHNGHVSRAGYGNIASMGTHLGRRHGQDLVVFGFCFHEGTYTAVRKGEGLGTWGTSASREGSAEWVFHQDGRPRLMLDLRQADAADEDAAWVHRKLDLRSIGSQAMDDAFHPGVMADKYDVMVYFETSTPSVLLAVPTPDSWSVWDD